MNDNPFAVLTAVVAPAILTNACSVLSLGTGNRIARVVDRTRALLAAQAPLRTDHPDYAAYSLQLNHLETRGRLLLRALRLFYASLGSFAASALVAVVGSALSAYNLDTAFYVAGVAGLAVGAVGVTCLVTGCTLVLQETRLAVQSLREEIDTALSHKSRV